MSVVDLKHCAAKLRELLLHYARFASLKVLNERSYRRKAERAMHVLRLLQAAASLQSWMTRTFHSASRPVYWNSYWNPTELNVLRNGEIDSDSLDSALAGLWTKLLDTRSETRDLCSYREFRHFAEDLYSYIPSTEVHDGQARSIDIELFIDLRRRERAHKSVCGPRTSHFDTSLVPSYSLTQTAAPKGVDRLETAVPYFWTLSSREAMVCDSCLLSLFEYDGLPLLFYFDMAQQAADEARHAVMYLDLAKELMPSWLNEVSRDHPARSTVAQYLSGKGQLPVPTEGNLFQCMRYATLEERLTIMQIETEGAAVAATRAAIYSPLAVKYPNVQRAFEVDYFDEVSHAKFGTRWLRHLLPDFQSRSEAIENAKLLRGVLLLTCFSEAGHGSIGKLMRDYADDTNFGTKNLS